MLPKNLFKNGFDSGDGSIDVDSLDHIRKFISDNFKKTKNINIKIGSYKLKHIAENSIKEMNGFVSNGDFIASMILEGYEYKIDRNNKVNANFNLSQDSVKSFF